MNIEEEVKKAFLDELKKDKYPEMTEKAVEELWNNDKYSRDGLWNIAFALMKKLWGFSYKD